MGNQMKSPRVEIEFCTQCRWLLRAAWLAQELLTTLQDELGEVALQPGTGGVFEIRVDGETVWSRHTEQRFPDAKELKQRVRDRVAPDKPLGHSDRKSSEDVKDLSDSPATSSLPADSLFPSGIDRRNWHTRRWVPSGGITNATNLRSRR